jgi:hypothetical protein
MSQLPLFGVKKGVSEPRPTDLAYIRKSLSRLLRTARDADIMPWSPAEADSWEKLFVELAASLPAEEAETLRSGFKTELDRLRSSDERGSR